jgi:type I restriction enzyme S subunit
MLSDKIVRLRFADACEPRFAQIANSSTAARRYYAEVAGGTSSSMKNVTRAQILALPVKYPSLAEQRRIVAMVIELLALCDQLKARVAAARAKHAQLAKALVEAAVA